MQKKGEGTLTSPPYVGNILTQRELPSAVGEGPDMGRGEEGHGGEYPYSWGLGFRPLVVSLSRSQSPTEPVAELLSL